MKTSDDLPIEKACPLEGELPGEGARRHCTACDTLVVDLSRMTSKDADALMRSPARPSCVSYLVDERGQVVHLPAPPVPARRRLPVIAGALLLAACNGAVPEGPLPTGASSAAVAATSPTGRPVDAPGTAEATAIAPPAPSASGAAAKDGEGCELDAKNGASTKTGPAATASAIKIAPHPPKIHRLRGKPARTDWTL